MGLAFFLGRIGGHRVAGHDGGWPGFVSALAFAPGTGTAVVAFTNTNTAFAPHVLAERVLQGLLEATTGAPAVAQHPHAWPELIGVYKLPRGLNTNFRWWPLIGGEVEIAVRKGRLVARAPSPSGSCARACRCTRSIRLTRCGSRRASSDWAVPVVFERGAQGDVVAVRAGSTRGGLLRLHRRSRAASLRLWARGGRRRRIARRRRRGMETLPMSTIVWHDVECGGYRADLPLWRELATAEAGPVLDVGAGAGRVALDLARAGHDVTALDRDAELLAELAARAAREGLEVRTEQADAAGFALPGPPFGLIVVPMQTIQLLPGRAARAAFFASAREHLASGGLVALALAEELEPFEVDSAAPAAARHGRARRLALPLLPGRDPAPRRRRRAGACSRADRARRHELQRGRRGRAHERRRLRPRGRGPRAAGWRPSRRG